MTRTRQTFSIYPKHWGVDDSWATQPHTDLSYPLPDNDTTKKFSVSSGITGRIMELRDHHVHLLEFLLSNGTRIGNIKDLEVLERISVRYSPLRYSTAGQATSVFEAALIKAVQLAPPSLTLSTRIFNTGSSSATQSMEEVSGLSNPTENGTPEQIVMKKGSLTSPMLLSLRGVKMENGRSDLDAMFKEEVSVASGSEDVPEMAGLGVSLCLGTSLGTGGDALTEFEDAGTPTSMADSSPTRGPGEIDAAL
ncbi:hypothetical protein EV424DRAFT_1577789 [Suillus variegatus]|nr:hypothetical protein EV424DRAFT_1577789 [Suillus variegatus]